MTINDHQKENFTPHDWRQSYSERPYYHDIQKEIPDVDYDRDFGPAYDLGRNARIESNSNTSFDDSESDLKQKWEEFKVDSRLKWEQAKHAVKDAWDKL
ncbi:MAG: hypothetical protein QM666_02265 [Acinetobacter sp.]